MTIDILCKVVDNYGDIGVVYRLARALGEAWAASSPGGPPPGPGGPRPGPGLSIRLHVDDLDAFRALCPEVDPAAEVQTLRGWTVLRWNSAWEGLRREPPRIVLECFACGRPDRLEEILFDPADPAPRTIVNVEHLTAEGWARDFHRLASATRSGLVRKWMFMPGFEPGTGGLVLDRAFREALARWRGLDDASRGAARRELASAYGLEPPALAEAAFWVPVFSYERDYRRAVADLAAFASARPLLALAAAGRGQAPFLAAWEEAGRPFPALALPFLPQERWDELLLASDFLVVRGEESLARAALAGKPFLWQAYLQEGGYQVVKVRALLERLRPHFPPEDFALLEALWLAFNDRLSGGPGAGGGEPLLPVLRRAGALEAGFAAFAAELLGLGDLASHLVTFIREIV